MKFQIKKENYSFKQGDNILIFTTDQKIKTISDNYSQFLPIDLNSLNLEKLKDGDPTLFIPLTNEATLIIHNLGDEEKVTAEKTKIAASTVISIAKKNKLEELHILLAGLSSLDNEIELEAIVEGLTLSNYSFSKYKNDDKLSKIKKATIYTNIKNGNGIVKEISIITNNVMHCRDLVNEISEVTTSEMVAKEAKTFTKIKNVTCKVYGKKDLEKMKMGLFLAVNRGSKIPPKLIVLKYNGDKDSKKYSAIVGKGVTFDAGGINLKPSGSIETMRMDMAGASATLYSFKSVAELGLKKNLYAVIPLTENMMSNDAYRPGDIFTGYDGTTVQIGNTDAEGRLILADSLAFTDKKLKAENIIDIATLTGAAVVAFGETVAPILTDDENIAKTIKESSLKTGELTWQLPMFEHYGENLKSDVADLNNISSEKNSGTITAAMFLKNFVKDAKWAHIDIAGPAWYSKARGYRPKNSTGFGVRLLTEIIRNI